MHHVLGIRFTAYANGCEAHKVIEIDFNHLAKHLPSLYVDLFLHCFIVCFYIKD